MRFDKKGKFKLYLNLLATSGTRGFDVEDVGVSEECELRSNTADEGGRVVLRDRLERSPRDIGVTG